MLPDYEIEKSVTLVPVTSVEDQHETTENILRKITNESVWSKVPFASDEINANFNKSDSPITSSNIQTFGFFSSFNLPWLSSIVIPVKLPSSNDAVTEESSEESHENTESYESTETTDAIIVPDPASPQLNQQTSTLSVSTKSPKLTVDDEKHESESQKEHDKSKSEKSDESSSEEDSSEEKKEENQTKVLKQKVAEIEAEPVILTQGV